MKYNICSLKKYIPSEAVKQFLKTSSFMTTKLKSVTELEVYEPEKSYLSLVLLMS